MKPSIREWLLLVVALDVLNVSERKVWLIILFYVVASVVDEYICKRRAKKWKEKVLDEEIYGWEQSKEDAQYEEWRGLSRIRLTGENRIVVTRVAELLIRLR